MLINFNNILLDEFNNKIYNYFYIFHNIFNNKNIIYRLYFYYCVNLYSIGDYANININYIFDKLSFLNIICLKNNNDIYNNLYSNNLLLKNNKNLKFLNYRINFITYLSITLNQVKFCLNKKKFLKLNIFKNKFKRKLLSFNNTGRNSLDFINYYRGS
jgi:hypothetical protein